MRIDFDLKVICKFYSTHIPELQLLIELLYTTSCLDLAYPSTFELVDALLLKCKNFRLAIFCITTSLSQF